MGRGSEDTRNRLLDVAQREIYRRGFAAVSVGDVLDVSGLSKGALYHHFEGKDSLGLAVVTERLRPLIMRFRAAIKAADDPVEWLEAWLRPENQHRDGLRYGCPVNNLSIELSATDEAFRAELRHVLTLWMESIEDALRQGQRTHMVRGDLDPGEEAAFLLACFEGVIGLNKNLQDATVLGRMLGPLRRHVLGYRPAP